MTIHLYHNDLPEGFDLPGDLAIDTETMGLTLRRDRLCLLQMTNGDGNVHIIQFAAADNYRAPNLKKLLKNRETAKIFHYARFDVAVIYHYLGVMCKPVYCTKIASRIARTYTDRHGLKDLARELLGIEISKQQQSSFWGAGKLSEDQLKYAATDVIYLHQIRDKLNQMLEATNRQDLIVDCFKFVPTRAILDIEGWEAIDIFAHS